MDGIQQQLIALLQIVMIDIVLAGDNAIVVGVAASRVAPEMRAKVIFWGIGGAVVLRILFAAVTTQLLAIVGLTLAGGVLLLWVCWKMYRELRHVSAPTAAIAGHGPISMEAPQVPMTLMAAITTIIVADISMSLDNVLAVAGAAKGNLTILVFGLALSVVLMAVAANYIAKILGRHPWIAWIGLAIIFYIAVEMMWRGAIEVGSTAAAASFQENFVATVLAAIR